MTLGENQKLKIYFSPLLISASCVRFHAVEVGMEKKFESWNKRAKRVKCSNLALVKVVESLYL